HMGGPLATGRLGSISCSGGEASLMADTAQGRAVTFPPLTQAQRAGLRDALGPMVALANPLDYHTYIWRDRAAMTRAWSAMVDPGLDMVLTVVDFPRADRCDAADWACAVDAAIAVHRNTGARVAMVATLPEAMPEDVALTLAAAGVVPLLGHEDALAGAEAAMSRPREPAPLLLPGDPDPGATLTEAEAKTALAAHGLAVPRAVRCPDTAAVASLAWDPDALCYPVVLKGEGVAHKTESGAVRLAIASPEALCQAALAMDAPGYLVEEMIEGAVAELLVGVVRDPAHGFLLTLGAGGTLTELLADRACLLVPSPPEAVRAALARLRTAPVLAGWRGAPAADMDAIVAAVMALQDYVIAEAEHLHEVEVNPLICTPDRVLAADALIRRAAAGSCQSVPDTTQNTAEREKLP
ncbi:MAG: acetate--CoA ligase family protein, partial [Pseudomonadota bacterium]